MNRTTRSRWTVLAALTLAFAGTPASAKKPTAPGAWQEIVPSGSVLGADGQPHTAACSGLPGTNPTFRFWTRPGKSKDLVVFFEGGGACWDNLTCSFPIGSGLPAPAPQFFVPAIAPGTDPATYQGLFRADQPANPVAGATMVYIPYCSGDTHIGSSSKQYYNAGNPFLPSPPNSFTLQHKGFDNFMVVLDWIRKNVDKPKNSLVTGPSAGGYGATANFPWIAESFPQAHMSLLADASQGVTTPSFDTGNPGRNSWNPQLAPWVFGNNPSAIPGHELISRVAAAYPKAKVAQFTTRLDEVQIGFYGVMKQFYPPGGVCPSPVSDWNQQMLGALSSYRAGVPNYRHYVAEGSYHTILRSPGFYTEASAGIPYVRWLDQMLANRGGTNGQGGGDWKNVACPGCLAPLPCF